MQTTKQIYHNNRKRGMRSTEGVKASFFTQQLRETLGLLLMHSSSIRFRTKNQSRISRIAKRGLVAAATMISLGKSVYRTTGEVHVLQSSTTITPYTTTSPKCVESS